MALVDPDKQSLVLLCEQVLIAFWPSRKDESIMETLPVSIWASCRLVCFISVDVFCSDQLDPRCQIGPKWPRSPTGILPLLGVRRRDSFFQCLPFEYTCTYRRGPTSFNQRIARMSEQAASEILQIPSARSVVYCGGASLSR